MHGRFGWALGGVLALLLAAPPSSTHGENAPLLEYTFEEDAGAWQALGPGAIKVTHDPANVKDGKGALEFAYSVGKGQRDAAIVPVAPGRLAKAQTFRFWAKADHDTTVVFILQESNGGRYAAYVAAPKDTWQQVELSLGDFFLSDGAGDPRDPDGKLDVDELTNIGFLDFAHGLSQSEDLAKVIKTGPHRLYVDDLVASDAALPEPHSAPAGEVPLDAFQRPQLGWAGVGVHLARVEAKSLDGPGLRADYRQERKMTGFVKRVRKGQLAGASKLHFAVASAKPAKLLVQVAELGGARYNKVVELPGGSKVGRVEMSFTDFQPVPEAKDSNGRLDPDLINEIVFVDVTAIVGEGTENPVDNTMWLNEIAASRPR